MSKFIKYHDFVQVTPDERILSLDKDNKILMIDNLLQSIEEDKKGLIITYDLSHSGRRINNRIYSTKGQQKGIDSLTDPYPKPILKNHNQAGEPIGRFIGGEWQSLNDIASDFLNSDKAMLDVHGAFSDDDPEKIYKTLKSLNLIDNKQWPGLGRMRVQANITDEEAIKKFLDGRYMTFSAGSTTDRHVCSICNQDWVSEGMCEHRHGKMYDGEICVFITGDFIVLEGSVVNTPADDLSQIVSIELSDNQESNTAVDSYSYPEEIMFSDSNYNLGEINGLQTAKQIEGSDNEEEEEEEVTAKEEDREYDHSMTLDESAMEELHSKGVTYIEESSGNQKMTIRVTYNGERRENNSTNETSEPKENDMNLETEKEVVEATTNDDSTEETIVESVDASSLEERKEEETKSPPPVEPEPEEETLDDSLDIDWNILDLALQATMAQTGSNLSIEDREQLDDAAFCGPDRSFPIPDCIHVDAAKNLITNTKLSDQVKDKVLALVDERAETLACDSESTALKSELSALKSMYQSLEEKFKTVINFIENNKSNKNDTEDNLNENGEKSEDTVEKADKDELIVDKEEKVFSLSDKVLSNMDQVTSPSEHANEEEHLGSKSNLDTLGAFEQKIVKEYKAVLSDHGKDAANSYLYSKSNYS